jgi:two-component system phosphate regulon sensor histidine kinase PhoR
MTFRTRTLLGVFVASSIALAVALALVSANLRRAMQDEIRQSLLRQAMLAAELLSDRPNLADPEGEAARIARLLGERVTFIAADGRVIGDSEVPADRLATLENHGSRPEVVQARAAGMGSARRLSATTGIETEYAAAAVVRGSSVDVVRVALELSALEGQLAAVRQQGLIGLSVGLVAAVLLTWVISRPLGRRLEAIAAAARSYREGDFSRPLRDRGSDEIGTLAGVLDETARELGVRLTQLARDRAHTDAILHGMVEGVVLVDGGGRLVLTNPAVRAMLRLPEGAADRHYLEVVRQPDIAAQLARALRGETQPAVEVQLDAEGRRTFSAHVVPVAAERGGGAVLVLHDITDLRHADQVRRDFVANVSHELRTPLTAIRGYVEALNDDPASPDAPKFLDIISRHTMRMERLVKDLLRLARLDAGQEPLDRSLCTIAALVAAAEHDVQASMAGRRQRLQVTIAPDAAVVEGDPAKLQDVLRNLIENASNYGPEDGVIDVATAPADHGIAITVADRGPGIPPSDMTRIFERFYRVDRSRSRDPGGTGLGLSIVRHLVELHGGRVSAANRDGGGSVLRVWLPSTSLGPGAA